MRARRAVPTALVAAAVAAALGPAAPAQAPPVDPVAVADLDGDGAPERLVVREITCIGSEGETPPPCAPDVVARRVQVDLVEDCRGVERRTPVLPRAEDGVDQLAVVEADGDLARREFIVSAFSGASGKAGSGMVGRLVADADGCATVRRLFAFGPSTPRTPRPRGAAFQTPGQFRLLSLRRDVRGKELRYSEAWYRRSDPGCCPRWIVTADHRYDRRTGRYVRYRTRVTRPGGR